MTSQKKRYKQSKTVVIFFIFLFIVVTSTVWLTMALLTARSDNTRNTFTLGSGVDITLTEPEFDKISTDKIKVDFIPGDVIDKDPTISIENGLEKEYIAATVFYYIDKNGDGKFSNDEEISYTDFKTYAFIGTYIDDITGFVSDGLGTGWFTIDDFKTFFYGTGIGKSAVTDGTITKLIPFEKEKDGIKQQTVLFNKVKVNSSIPLYSADTYADGKLIYKKGQPMSFQIQIKAYAVQAGDGITWQQAALDFNKTFGLNIGTTSLTP